MPLPTYFQVMTPSVFTMNVAGLARPESWALCTLYSRVTSIEGSYRTGKGMPNCRPMSSAPLRLSTLMAITSAFRVFMLS